MTTKKLIPVPKWNNYHEWPSLSGLRNLIFHKKNNGFDELKVVKKVGKLVFIDEGAFFHWIEYRNEIDSKK